MSQFNHGDFVKVKADSEFRPGEDGFVVIPEDENGELALIFLFDRNGQTQPTGSLSGIEAWNINELDLTTHIQ